MEPTSQLEREDGGIGYDCQENGSLFIRIFYIPHRLPLPTSIC